MSAAIEVIAGLNILVGVLLMGLAGLGLLRLPDAYARMNAAGKAGGLGVVCLVAGSALIVGDPEAGVTAVLAIIFQLVTVPVGSFAIARAAHRAGTPLDPSTAFDQLTDEKAARRDGTPGPTPLPPARTPPQGPPPSVP